MDNIKLNCRVCNSEDNLANLTNFFPKRFNQFFLFSYRGFNSSSIYCRNCGSLSFYNDKKVNYKSGEYRNKDNKKLPIDLPWATITYKRYKDILKIIDSYLPNKINADFKLLDFGGYNGFCAYGICENLGIPFSNGYIADLDPNGLSVASALGLSTYNLGIKSLDKHLKNSKNKFNLITAVQVLEHLEKPDHFFSEIRNYLNNDGIIYIEVPSKFFFPLSDKAHLTTFTKEGIIKLAERKGFKIIKNGTKETPRESILYGYPLSSKFETQFFVFNISKEIKKTNPYKIKKSRYGLVKFILKAFLSDIILRVIITTNYVKLFNKILASIVKSIILLILTPIFISFKIINIFFFKIKL